MKAMDVVFAYHMVVSVQLVLDQCLLMVERKDALVMQYHAAAQLLPVLQMFL
jgi:hypothetical protein